MEQVTDLEQAAVLAAKVRTYLNAENYSLLQIPRSELALIAHILDCKIKAAFSELSYSDKQLMNSQITVELMKTGIMKQEMPTQPEVMPATVRCLEPYKWSCFDGVATEVEMLEFLHSLVRLLKPEFVLETGTYLGYGAVYMALAMQKNGFGSLLSCDTDVEALDKATTLAMINEVDKIVRFVPQSGADVIRQIDDRSLDMVFIDSGDAITRCEEIALVIPKMKLDNSLCVVHDTGSYSQLETYLNGLEKEKKIYPWHVPCTPRGFSFFTRRHY